MKQILLNLLRNSLKFTKAGEICLTTKFIPRSEIGTSKDIIQIEVFDTGIGIKE